ncbi:hypothetical protein [Clostridium tertium]|uniref:Uncharacterized protein n=1 Tax=Clostridium tertium TaxID=1559 RepID=A0A6N3GEH6_9CLOT
MHIKVMKKKKGFSLVETIIIFMLIIVISNISLKFILNNYLRSQQYYTYSDVKSLSIDDEAYLDILNVKVKNNSEVLNDIQNLNKEIKEIDSSLKKYALEKVNNKYYITKTKNSSKIYIGLDENRDKEYLFSPSTYKTQYIYGGS